MRVVWRGGGSNQTIVTLPRILSSCVCGLITEEGKGFLLFFVPGFLWPTLSPFICFLAGFYASLLFAGGAGAMKLNTRRCTQDVRSGFVRVRDLEGLFLFFLSECKYRSFPGFFRIVATLFEGGKYVQRLSRRKKKKWDLGMGKRLIFVDFVDCCK